MNPELNGKQWCLLYIRGMAVCCAFWLLLVGLCGLVFHHGDHLGRGVHMALFNLLGFFAFPLSGSSISFETQSLIEPCIVGFSSAVVALLCLRKPLKRTACAAGLTVLLLPLSLHIIIWILGYLCSVIGYSGGELVEILSP